MDKNLEKIVRKPVEDLGYILYDVIYEKEGSDWFLRVIIDSNEKEITLDDCVNVTEALNPILDKEDPIKNEYMFEVASAGAEKELKTKEDVDKAKDKYVHVETNKDIYEGFLIELDDKTITVKINLKGRMKNILINREDITLIRLAVKF